MVYYILKDSGFDFPEAPPPSSSPPFEFFDMDLPPSSSAPPEPAVEPSKCIRKPTAKRRMALEDALPEGPGPIDARPEPPRAVSPVRNILLRLPRLLRTVANSFGVSRLYINTPTHIPDADIALPDMVADHASNKKNGGKSEKSVLEMISPYPNVSAFRLGNWFWNGSYKKSKDERDKLINMMLKTCEESISTKLIRNLQKIRRVLGSRTMAGQQVH